MLQSHCLLLEQDKVDRRMRSSLQMVMVVMFYSETYLHEIVLDLL